MMINYTGKAAEISKCGQYRYMLSRWWNARYPGRCVMFIGVNPSTADANDDDQTIQKMVGFASRWGFDGMCVGNLFAYRATDVKELKKCSAPAGDENDGWLQDMARVSALIVPCWGSSGKLPKSLRDRILEVEGILSGASAPAKCFGFTISNDPIHPLMLGYNTPLVEFPKATP